MNSKTDGEQRAKDELDAAAVVDNWQKLEPQEFDRLKRDELREELLAAYDAEVTRRRSIPNQTEAPETADSPECGHVEYRLDWTGALKASFGLIAGGVVLFVVVMIIRHFAGFPVVGGDLGTIVAMMMIIGGILALPRGLVRLLKKQSLRVSAEGIALHRGQKTLAVIAASDLNETAWGFKEDTGANADPLGMIADAIGKRGPYLTDGKRDVFLRVFGGKRVVEALRRYLPANTPHSFMLVAARGDGFSYRTKRFVLFPGLKYHLRFSDGAFEKTELPDADFSIEVPREGDLLFSTEHDDFVTTPKKTKRNEPFSPEVGRVETKAGVIVVRTCE